MTNKRFKLFGKFVYQNVKQIQGKKDPSKTYRTGEAVFDVVYQHENGETGETYVTKYPVPFKVFGDRICDLVETLQFEDECEIFFEVAGRAGEGQYAGKYFCENKASAIKKITQATGSKPPQAKGEDDIPF